MFRYTARDRERQGRTMAGIEPHGYFETWNPDEVAECMNVPRDLYTKLWGLVEEYRQPKAPEYPEEKWQDGLARFWGRFTPDEQRQLNDAAERY